MRWSPTSMWGRRSLVLATEDHAASEQRARGPARRRRDYQRRSMCSGLGDRSSRKMSAREADGPCYSETRLRQSSDSSVEARDPPRVRPRPRGRPAASRSRASRISGIAAASSTPSPPRRASRSATGHAVKERVRHARIDSSSPCRPTVDAEDLGRRAVPSWRAAEARRSRAPDQEASCLPHGAERRSPGRCHTNRAVKGREARPRDPKHDCGPSRRTAREAFRRVLARSAPVRARALRSGPLELLVSHRQAG